jgi:hypothetical protein
VEIWPEDKIFSLASFETFLLLNVIIHSHKKAKDMVNVENSKIKKNFMKIFENIFWQILKIFSDKFWNIVKSTGTGLYTLAPAYIHLHRPIYTCIENPKNWRKIHEKNSPQKFTRKIDAFFLGSGLTLIALYESNKYESPKKPIFFETPLKE